ncbi:hypothetical protein BpHYR1_039424 [Brachionus plicatilis]|uniref:Uncharacterized protein n=1 Tax=Brachionus plicatilis TaxID=10195 RepID=A0A3M7R0Z1_BRAPC|nr:hypothetical protein BpHYR1_039424 [Brachionus plicatilis]
MKRKMKNKFSKVRSIIQSDCGVEDQLYALTSLSHRSRDSKSQYENILNSFLNNWFRLGVHFFKSF